MKVVVDGTSDHSVSPLDMTNNAFSVLTVAQLKRAVAIKERIERLESELGLLLRNSSTAEAVPTPRRGKRRKISAAGRAKIAAAAKARWARYNASKSNALKKPRRKM